MCLEFIRRAGTNINRTCTYSVTPNEGKPQVFHWNETSYLLIRVSKYDIVCRRETTKMTGCDTCIITIATGCKYSDTKTLITELTQQSQNTATGHLLNIPLIQKFFSEEVRKELDPAEPWLDSPIINIPDFKFFEHAIQQELMNIENNKMYFGKDCLESNQ